MTGIPGGPGLSEFSYENSDTQIKDHADDKHNDPIFFVKFLSEFLNYFWILFIDLFSQTIYLRFFLNNKIILNYLLNLV